MSFQIYQPRTEPRNWRRVAEKVAETTIKFGLLLAFPLPAAAIAAVFWYFVPHSLGWHWSGELEAIAVDDWIPIAGFFYGLLATAVIESVWREYKEIRRAIKSYDILTFMHLRDEDISPLMHALMWVLGLVILGAFMGLEYPTAASGMMSAAGAAYLLCLIFIIIVEIDNPFVGVWFIKHVHDEWLKEDARAWRERRRAAILAQAQKDLAARETISENLEVREGPPIAG